MEHEQALVKARIDFLSSEEGGRTSPLQGRCSYRPNHNFFGPDNRDMCLGFIELADGEEVTPGDTIEKVVTLSIFPAVKAEIRQGRVWRVQEGASLVATATILQVLDVPT